MLTLVLGQQREHALAQALQLIVAHLVLLGLVGQLHLQLVILLGNSHQFPVLRHLTHLLQQVACLVGQRTSALLTEREVVQRMTRGANYAATRLSTFRAIDILFVKTCATEGAHIRLDIMMTCLTKIGIWIYLTTTVGANARNKESTAQSAVGGIWIVYRTTLGTGNAICIGSLPLHHLLHLRSFVISRPELLAL